MQTCIRSSASTREPNPFNRQDPFLRELQINPKKKKAVEDAYPDFFPDTFENLYKILPPYGKGLLQKLFYTYDRPSKQKLTVLINLLTAAVQKEKTTITTGLLRSFIDSIWDSTKGYLSRFPKKVELFSQHGGTGLRATSRIEPKEMFTGYLPLFIGYTTTKGMLYGVFGKADSELRTASSCPVEKFDTDNLRQCDTKYQLIEDSNGGTLSIYSGHSENPFLRNPNIRRKLEEMNILGQFANDGGYSKNREYSELCPSHNAEIMLFTQPDKINTTIIALIATRVIEPKEPISVRYGREFWAERPPISTSPTKSSIHSVKIAEVIKTFIICSLSFFLILQLIAQKQSERNESE